MGIKRQTFLICLVLISRYSAVISKMLKYAEINILDITVEHLDITIEHIRWLSYSLTLIFLRVGCKHITCRLKFLYTYEIK